MRLWAGKNLSRYRLRMALGMLLALLAMPAFALGLGQIQVKSRSGQPLLAEIPIISSDPAELHGLQARLASPETFSRVGLEPPAGIVSDLQFNPALDQQGRPVIRVTTARPVEQPFLKFLVEVDWGQGRLVREYSALVDTPTAVAAPVQPPIQAPAAAADNRIERTPPVQAPLAGDAMATDASEQTPATDAATAEQASPTAIGADVATQGGQPVAPDQQFAAVPALQPQDILAAPSPQAPPPEPDMALAPAPTESPPAESAPSAINGEAYVVQRGDSLSAIATRLPGIRGVSRNQTMVAMLRANPEAFIGGNINLVKAGARLRIPEVNEVFATEAADADAMIRDHVRNWRSGQAPVAQPAAIAGTGAESRTASATSGGSASATAGARLEIAPPSAANARNAGNTSGISAGGEGQMLRQDLQQAQETLAARNAEVEELKARVAELESLQQDQQRLIQLKDGELAAAQARAGQTQTAAVQAAPEQQASGTPGWLWTIPVALLLGTIAIWLLARRRRAAVPAFPRRAPLDISAAMPPAAPATVDTEADASPAAAPSPDTGPAWARPGSAPLPPRAAAPAAAATVADGAKPTWYGPYDNAQNGDAAASERQDARLEQARTCIEQGDLHGARQRLHAVIENGEARARAEAGRLLRELS